MANRMSVSARVSILSQPEGRELLRSRATLIGNYMFQSSPSPKAGSYVMRRWYRLIMQCFNPLPARRPGATIALEKALAEYKVSILSQPEGRELLYSSSDDFYADDVSILSQPEGRELPL